MKSGQALQILTNRYNAHYRTKKRTPKIFEVSPMFFEALSNDLWAITRPVDTAPQKDYTLFKTAKVYKNHDITGLQMEILD